MEEDTTKISNEETLNAKDELIKNLQDLNVELNNKIKKLESEIIPEKRKYINLFDGALKVVHEYGCHESKIISEELGQAIYKLGLLLMKDL